MTSKKRILVVEDDLAMVRVLGDNMLFEGFEVRCVTDGRLVLDAVRDFSPDLIILDVTLPGASGFELAELIRRKGRIPLLFLTARSQKADKVHGLQLGADDYITKPFDLDELILRVKAVLRRARPEAEELTLGEVRIDLQRHTAFRGDVDLNLTHREFELLRYLAQRQGEVVLRDELLRAVWGYAQTPYTRSVDNAIARLRKKIEPNPHRPRFIHTVHGDGYSFTPNGVADPSASPADSTS